MLDLPRCPASANDPNLQGGCPVDASCVSLEAGERALALTALRADGPGLALGTRQGVVKRVNPEVLGNATSGRSSGSRTATRWSARSSCAPATRTLCFITSDAQLLHFGADGVRPQGRSGGGMAGVRLAAGAAVVWFGALDPGATPSSSPRRGSSTALPGTEPGAVKVTPFSEYPGKGRATGGVRCHRFLKGEDALVLRLGRRRARPAPRPRSGAPVDLPEADRPARRLRRPGLASRSSPAPGRSPARLGRADARVTRLTRMLTSRVAARRSRSAVLAARR